LEDWLFLLGLFCRRYSEVADRAVLRHGSPIAHFSPEEEMTPEQFNLLYQ